MRLLAHLLMKLFVLIVQSSVSYLFEMTISLILWHVKRWPKVPFLLSNVSLLIAFAKKPGKKGYPQFKKHTRSVEYKTTGWALSTDKRCLTLKDGFAAGKFKLIGSRDLHFYAPREMRANQNCASCRWILRPILHQRRAKRGTHFYWQNYWDRCGIKSLLYRQRWRNSPQPSLSSKK